MKSQANVFVLSSLLVSCLSLFAQQKGQWVPGQSGLNAGVLPDAGFTFANLTLNYSATELKDEKGSSIPTQGSYGFWIPEQVFYYVPSAKVLGGKLAFVALMPFANGSVTAPTFGASAGGEGYSDTYVQPATLGWNLKHVDTYVAYGFAAPTGTFFPGSSSNNGSGYFGNDFVTGTTAYLTKNKATTLNLTTAWEFHGQKKGTNIIPGQAFTDEWGLGQIIPLKKDLTRLAQLGIIGYDQWQVSANQGVTATFPFYSVHAIGIQSNLIFPTRGLMAYFKYEPEYLAKARPQGRTFAFGFSWTLRDPKTTAKP